MMKWLPLPNKGHFTGNKQWLKLLKWIEILSTINNRKLKINYEIVLVLVPYPYLGGGNQE